MHRYDLNTLFKYFYLLLDLMVMSRYIQEYVMYVKSKKEFHIFYIQFK